MQFETVVGHGADCCVENENASKEQLNFICTHALECYNVCKFTCKHHTFFPCPVCLQLCNIVTERSEMHLVNPAYGVSCVAADANMKKKTTLLALR